VNVRRREFLRFAAIGFVEAGASAARLSRSSADDHGAIVNVRSFGAVGDGQGPGHAGRELGDCGRGSRGEWHRTFSTPARIAVTRSGSRALSRSTLSRAR
jgi:hypothetical protein